MKLRKEKVKVAIWGFGAMGTGMAKMIIKKEGFDLIGVCDNNPKLAGRNVFEILNLEKEKEIDVISNIENFHDLEKCDVVLLATDSYTNKAFPKIKYLLEHKVNVICTAEEMAYPKAKELTLSKELDEIAKANKVSVLGTGVNPGMMMDLLVIFLTGVMEDVSHIKVSRVNSLSPFGETVMEEQGVGLTALEFSKLRKDNKIAGHVGFRESIKMISDAIGLDVNRIDQQMIPIISDVDRKSKYKFVEAGNVAGVDMRAQAYNNSEMIIEMNHPQQIEPQLGGVQTGDYITIEGSPFVNMQISPEVDGGIGTIAICVNMIPHIINASPGLKTMIDLPVPRAIMSDVRNFIDET